MKKILILIIVFFSCNKERGYYTHISKVQLQLCIGEDKQIRIFDENGKYILVSKNLKTLILDIKKITYKEIDEGDTIRALFSYPDNISSKEKREYALELGKLFEEMKLNKKIIFNPIFFEDKILWVCD